MRENQSIKIVERRFDGAGVADASKPSPLVELYLGHLASPRFVAPTMPLPARSENGRSGPFLPFRATGQMFGAG